MEIHTWIEALQLKNAPAEALLAGLRAGEEASFAALVDMLGPSMLRVAKLHVRRQQIAEEVVQETWLRVLRGLDGFERRSSLRTWIFAILGNCARRRAERESRYVLWAEPAEDEWFFPPSHPRWAGMWTTRVDDWDGVPEDRLLAREGREALRDALEELPPAQATVFVLRDVHGWDGPAVCDVLDLSAANQRVLLHRARAHIRRRIAEYLEEEQR